MQPRRAARLPGQRGLPRCKGVFSATGLTMPGEMLVCASPTPHILPTEMCGDVFLGRLLVSVSVRLEEGGRAVHIYIYIYIPFCVCPSVVSIGSLSGCFRAVLLCVPSMNGLSRATSAATPPPNLPIQKARMVSRVCLVSYLMRALCFAVFPFFFAGTSSTALTTSLFLLP